MRILSVWSLIPALVLVSSIAPRSRADYVVVNHSNESVSVTVTYHLPDGRQFTTGWYGIDPNDQKAVYVGNEERICVAILRGPNRVQITPPGSFGTADRFIHSTSAFNNEDDPAPGVAKLSWDGNVFFKNATNPLPPGWAIQRFFVLRGSETFEVVP